MSVNSTPEAPGIKDRPVLLFHPNDDPVQIVQEWTSRPALRQLVEAFGGSWIYGLDPADRLESLVAFSRVWDRRAGRPRLAFKSNTTSRLDPTTRDALDALGLISQCPPSGRNADYVLVLGGTASGSWARIDHCTNMLRQRQLAPISGIALLGSFRPLHLRETTFLRTLGPTIAGATSEAELLEIAASTLMPGTGPWRRLVEGNPQLDPNRAKGHSQRSGKLPLHVIAAASSEPNSRNANTADTLLLAARELPIRRNQYLQLVTTGLYSVFQFFDAIRLLGVPIGVSIEMIGLTPRGLSSMGAPEVLLQELRSAIRSALALQRNLIFGHVRGNLPS